MLAHSGGCHDVSRWWLVRLVDPCIYARAPVVPKLVVLCSPPDPPLYHVHICGDVASRDRSMRNHRKIVILLTLLMSIVASVD
ncbi:hypothetical protein BD310DRAFT_932522 [Dichomitus squalens]|uniref:Uncharacterized protein n=1 Tax=Dichomitus squalens TaxID=114155 RepID=A0A4V2K7F3_9APHY|nr:hypothetical protein BD310DRAFT_932522 [Dichomitus squalens]